METLIKDKMTEFVKNHDLLSDNHHGFTSAKSCLTNLLEILEVITSDLDNSSGVDIIFQTTRRRSIMCHTEDSLRNYRRMDLVEN